MSKFTALEDFISHSIIKDSIIECYQKNDELFLIIEPDQVASFFDFIKNNNQFKFEMLIDLCAVDYIERIKRFEIVYNLLSLTANLRLTVKTSISEEYLIQSISHIYPAAGWYEREAFDMYGVFFKDHNDLRRILTDYGFVGHPMRKDFPLTGFYEVRYDIERKKVNYEKVNLVQDFRNFDFASPWSGDKYILPGDEKTTK